MTKNVYAYDKYEMEDYAFFDPVTSSPCDDSNYWTLYNQDTTCYRFVVLNPDDNASNNTIKLLLDHDLGTSTYNDYQSVLSNATSNWSRYSSNIDIPDESTIASAMKLTTLPTIEAGHDSVNGGVQIYTLRTNSLYVINGNTTNNAGYWVKGDYSDGNYAYSVTEYGNNRLIQKSSTRGVRPMITIDKSLLKKSKNVVDKTNDFKSSKEYQYPYIQSENNSYDGYSYRQLQAFTITNSKLAFYSTHAGNPNKGLVVSYGGDNYGTLNKIDYGETGHGNGMTFNSNTNKVLLLGATEGNYNIYEYDGDTLNHTNTYANSEGYTAIGYDDHNNYYYMLMGRRVYLTDTSFNKLYSFDVPALLRGQDIAYHNGYLYYVAYDGGVDSSNQLYSFGEAYSARIYVYNAKLKSDKTPDKDFGRLDKIIYIGNIPRTNDPNKSSIYGTGEIEGISFSNNKVVLGYAAQQFDSTNTFKFYELDYSKIMSDLNLRINYTRDGNKNIVVINSNTELNGIDGWILSNDKYTLTKTYEDSEEPFNVTICDKYGNCTNTVIDHNNPHGDDVVPVPDTLENEKYKLIKIIISVILIGVGLVYIHRKKPIMFK